MKLWNLHSLSPDEAKEQSYCNFIDWQLETSWKCKYKVIFHQLLKEKKYGEASHFDFPPQEMKIGKFSHAACALSKSRNSYLQFLCFLFHVPGKELKELDSRFI